MHPSGGNHTKYDPPHPPAGLAHDADPAHLSASLCFCVSLFSVQFPTAFFMNFGSAPGPENRPKLHPGAEKVRFRSELFAIFGANRRFLRILVDLEPKNDEKSTFFSMLFRAAARFFFNPANLDFDWQAQYFGGFGDFLKNTIFQKNVAKIVFKTDRRKTS